MCKKYLPNKLHERKNNVGQITVEHIQIDAPRLQVVFPIRAFVGAVKGY